MKSFLKYAIIIATLLIFTACGDPIVWMPVEIDGPYETLENCETVRTDSLTTMHCVLRLPDKQ